MNRDEIRERFSPLLDGELSPEERAEVEAALSEDAELLRELDALKRVDHLYANLPPVNAPVGFEDGVKSALYPATLQFTRARAIRRRLWPMLAAAAVFIVVGAIVVVQMNPAMAPMMLSKEMADYAAESIPQSANEESSVMADRSLEAGAPKAEIADETAVQSLAPLEASETDTEAVQGPGAVSSGPANGQFQGRNLSAREGNRSADAMKVQPHPAPATGPAPMVAPQEADRSEGLASPQRQALDEPQAAPPPDSASNGAGGMAATKITQSEPQFFSGETAGATAPSAEPPTPPAMRGRDAMDSSENARPEENLAREKLMLSEESVLVNTRALAERTFQRRGEDWIQEGYNDESLTTVHRESDAWNVLVRKDFDLAGILELESRVVFKQGDIWYELLPAESTTR